MVIRVDSPSICVFPWFGQPFVSGQGDHRDRLRLRGRCSPRRPTGFQPHQRERQAWYRCPREGQDQPAGGPGQVRDGQAPDRQYDPGGPQSGPTNPRSKASAGLRLRASHSLARHTPSAGFLVSYLPSRRVMRMTEYPRIGIPFLILHLEDLVGRLSNS